MTETVQGPPTRGEPTSKALGRAAARTDAASTSTPRFGAAQYTGVHAGPNPMPMPPSGRSATDRSVVPRRMGRATGGNGKPRTVTAPPAVAAAFGGTGHASPESIAGLANDD